jgi:hypothetical protein
MLKPGDSYHYLTETSLGETDHNGRVRYANNPIVSTNTALVFFAVTYGFRLFQPGAFRDTVEQTDKGPLRKWEWFIDGSSKGFFVWAVQNAEKKWVAQVEEIDFPELLKRWNSEEWCLANEHHPIAGAKWFVRHWNEGRDAIRGKTASVIRRGRKMVTIPANLPDDKKQQLLSYLK